MYSGSDSTGSQNINQWPLNPAAYQNTPNEQIDWAALAQQWIIMKEAGPPVPDQIPIPIPPSNILKGKKDNVPEGGEAPMEVDNEKEDDAQPHWNDSTSTPEGSWNWNQQQQWGWGNTWSAPSGVPPPGTTKAPLLPTPPSYNQFSSPTENSGNFGGYNRPPTSEFSGGYWTANANKMKPHNKRYSKINVPPRPPIASTAAMPDPVMLDASKRKQLPAWIREGLEKMERDKQKQIEREREKLEKEDQTEQSKLNEKEALEIIKSTVKERERSKFDSDGEDSEVENNSNNKEKVHEIPESTVLTQEELMLKVRHTMTEILLKVTNQEIRAVCKEEFQRHLRKYKASDLRVSASSGTNISAKLGLGMYGDSGSSSGSSGDESDQDKNDSDAELKDMIKRRKAEFSKTEREIEERLAAVEKHVDTDSRGGTPKADDCDSQVDAKSQGHKVKLSEDATPPKTAFKRFKSRRASTSSSTKSDSEHDKYSEQKDKRVIRTKKSSSSESNRSQKVRNKKSRSSRDARSTTPERKKVKEKRHSDDRKTKHSESSSSKSSSSRSRKSRSKSIEQTRKRRSRSADKYRRNSVNHKRSYSKKSLSRSSSRSRRSRSYTRSHRSRSRSYTKSDKSRKSRSPSLNSRSRTRSVRSHKSRSRDRRSRSRSSRSRHRSKSYSPKAHRHRRAKSRSNSRGKRSHRH